MGDEEKLTEFLNNREDEYEALMVSNWEVATTLGELSGYHRMAKAEILAMLQRTWYTEMGSAEMPDDCRNRTAARITARFERFKTDFQNKNRDSNQPCTSSETSNSNGNEAITGNDQSNSNGTSISNKAISSNDQSNSNRTSTSNESRISNRTSTSNESRISNRTSINTGRSNSNELSISNLGSNQPISSNNAISTNTKESSMQGPNQKDAHYHVGSSRDNILINIADTVGRTSNNQNEQEFAIGNQIIKCKETNKNDEISNISQAITSKEVNKINIEEELSIQSSLQKAEETHSPAGGTENIPSTITNTFSTSNNENEPKEFAIGIDLGTTMCCVAVICKGKVEIVQNRKQGNVRITPSYVSFREDGSDSFGVVAKRTAYHYPETTIYDAKRMIGRTWEDQYLQNDKKVWPFEIIDDGGNPKVKTGEKTRYPHEISARLLSHLRAMAEEFLNLKRGAIKKAVITVPAYFSEPQRRATNDAAVCAGLEVLNILSEPTAAAIAYNWERRVPGTRRTLIYDLGGGTFDVAIATVETDNVNMICVHGDTHLGGQDFDQLLMEYCIEKFKSKSGIDLLDGKENKNRIVRDEARRALSRLRLQCEAAKEWLSSTDLATVDVSAIAGNKDLVADISLQTLEELCKPLVERTLEIVDMAIADAAAQESCGIKGKEDIDDVILVGGSTRMPLVMKMVSEFFGGKQLCTNINPDEAVAHGAAIQADILGRTEVTPVEHVVQVQDVTPRTVGIECLDDTFSKVIPRNSKIPCVHEEIYNTSDDNQTSLRFSVCQGESDRASENIQLGEFIFKGIPPSPAEQEKIKVTMSINLMGILQVKAISLTNGKENAITISSNQLGMSDMEIEQLKEELQLLL